MFDEQVVVADVHVEVVEAACRVVYLAREAEVDVRGAIGASRYGCRQPLLGRVELDHAREVVVYASAAARERRVCQHDLRALEAAGHICYPLVVARHGVGRSEQQTVVVGELDAEVERHFDRYRKARVGLDLRGGEVLETYRHHPQILVELAVGAYVYDHYLVVVVVLFE